MGIFQRLFGRTSTQVEETLPQPTIIDQDDDWELLPGYVPADSEDEELVALIASSIAAGDKPDSEFTVKKIWKRNPEVLKISLIATSIASIDRPDSQLVVKSVYRKK